MKKTFALSYGVVCYLAFFATTLYAIGFVGNLIVPKTIDGVPEVSLPVALLINASLVLLFVLQHKIMAGPEFKKWWIKFIPEYLERSTYILLASTGLLLLMCQWQPVGGVIWSVENEAAKNLLFITFFCGWFIVFFSTFLINHFDLFGLRQVWFFFKGKPYPQLPLRVPLFYKMVRHPLHMGFLIAFWSTPVMTIAHLVFVILTTAYVIVIQSEISTGIVLNGPSIVRLEEKDLQALFETNT